MSLSTVTSPSRLTQGLTPAKIKELASLILKNEHPHTSREVLDPLLELLVGGQFDLNENYQIREPSVILLLLELLPCLTEPLQLEIWSSLGVILHRSLWNIHSCRHLQLTEQCLRYLSRLESSKVSSHVTRVIEILAGYNLSVKELRVLLSYLYAGQMDTWAPHSIAVVGALNNISAEVQPDVFFNFSGAAGAALTLPPLSKWPTTSGFTFTTWLQIEKPYDSQYYKPVVYWFRTGRQLGYSAHLVRSTLILETVGKSGHKKPQTNAVDFVFQSYQWYMLTVVYVHNRIRSSQLCVYVNGKPVLNANVSLPSTDDVYDKCFVGSSPVATEDNVFQGQMSAIYLFREPLSPDSISALHKLGPSYKSQFKFDAESDVPLTKQQKKVLFDGHLSSVLMFSYNAKAVDGQLCLEASPVENEPFFVHSPHATLLEGVDPVITTSFHSALHSLGGVQALFPLLSQLDLPQGEPHGKVDHSLSVKILSLIFELARNSTSFMLQLVQMKAMELISYLLEKASSQHTITELVSCIFDFAKYLMMAPNGVDLLCQLIEHLLCSASLWIRASEKVQIYLYSRLATEFSGGALGGTGVSLRELIGIPHLLFILRKHYSLAVAPDGPVHTVTLQVVRPYLLLIMKEIVTKGDPIQRGEMESLLEYLGTVPQEENLHDVLKLLLALVFEDKHDTVVKMFLDCDGLKVATKLLACTSEELTLHALQLIGKALHHLLPKKQQHLIKSAGLFAVIREKLLSAGQPVSIAMFNALFQVLVDRPSRRIIAGHYLALDLSHQIKFPRMLAVIVDLLCSLHTRHSEWDESDTLMRMQLFSYISSLCAQSQANCMAILRLPNWEHWLLMLADQQGAVDADYCNLQDMAYSLFHTLLLYAFQEEQDGWRVWVEIAATMHAYTESKAASMPQQLDCSATFVEFQSNSASSSVEHIRNELTATPTFHEDPTVINSEPNSTVPNEEESVPVRDETSHLCTEEVHGSVKDSLLVEEISKQRTTSPLATTSLKVDHLQPLKSPSLALASPSLSRTSSTETPQSPFFIPRNPFLSLVGKIPKYQWSLRHIQLLGNLLKSLRAIVEKWKCSSPSKSKQYLAESIGDESNKYLRSNIVHLLALTTDNVIALNGGLKHLLARSSNPKISVKQKTKRTDSIKSTQSGSLRTAVADDPLLLEGLLNLCLELSNVVVLSGLLKLDTIEARMKMEPGGAIKQGLRIVLAAASLSCMQANKQYKAIHEQYYIAKQTATQLHQDSVHFLQSLGVGTCSLATYFSTSYQKKLEAFRGYQCLLTNEYLVMMKKCIPSNADNKPLLQQLVVALMYYLSAMCVSKYRNILEAGDSEHTSGQDRSDTLASESATSITSTISASSDFGTPVKSNVEDAPQEPTDLSSPNFGVEQSLVPTSFPLFSHALDISEQIEAAMQVVGPFLCELLVEYGAMLSKVLVGSDGRVLLSDAVMKLAENKSVVEMTMLLCSQEWQGSLQKMGGTTFTEILTEGKAVAHFVERYLKSVASKATTDFEKQVNAENDNFTDFEEQLSHYLSQSVRNSSKNYQLRRVDVIRHSASAKELWRKISNLVDETGSFDSTPLQCSAHKKLDLREDAFRQRLQLVSNPNGSSQEGAVRSVGSIETPESKEGDLNLAVLKPVLMARSSHSDNISLGSDDPVEVLSLEVSVDQDTSSQLLSLPCHMIVLAHSIPGTLVVTSSSLTFTTDDSSEEYTKASYLSDYCPINGKWLLQDILAIFSRRYLQQNKALELFFASRSSVFFVLESSKAVKTIVRRLPKVGVGAAYDLPQTRAMSLASPQQLFKKSAMTTKWEQREVSNFEYLMYLNTIAGRTYNDLNQYPVFPWILTDYTSEYLDLSNPDIYRDLSKPIGALNASRFSQFEERYMSWEDNDVPAFYYGTHYSTMAFVLHWLVRVEPFASMHINFHDGFFDHGSRMFVSLRESWRNSSEDTSDVNELTPEFFYLPEMLLNDNKFNLGREGPCDEGGFIDSVKMPPWARSAHEFIRIHRKALESEHVSSMLHLWIDLIFGYKQKGEEAIKAKNVFYYLTYMGAIDLESVEDPKLRRGLEEQIRHFGQTPAQLLSDPHPQRQPLVKGFPPQPHSGLNPRDPALVAELQMTPDVPVALVQLSQALLTPGPNMLIVSYNQLYSLNKWSVHPGTTTQPPSVTLQPDPRIGSGLKTRLGDPLDQRISASSACFAATPICDVIFVCGYWDNSFKCFSATSGSMIQSVFGHCDIVTCLHFASESGLHCTAGDGLICTGSHDTTVLLWRWSDKAHRVIGTLSEAQVDSLTPVAVLTGHQQSVACVSVSCSLGLVVSGPKRGPCLVHDTTGELLFKVAPSPLLAHPHMISLTSNGHIVIHYKDGKGHLAVFTCNGKQLCHSVLQDPALALSVSKDGRYILLGGFDYRVRVFMNHNLELKHAHEPFNSSVRSMYITDDQRFILVGLASGSVVVLTTHFWR